MNQSEAVELIIDVLTTNRVPPTLTIEMLLNLISVPQKYLNQLRLVLN